MPITPQTLWDVPGFASAPIFEPDDWRAAAEGGYPPIPELPIPPSVEAAPFTVAQVQDIANACSLAMSSGKPEPLAMPFTYAGPNVPGVRTGDVISHIVSDGAQCVTSAEADRICAGGSKTALCEARGMQIPTWAYAAAGVGALAFIWYATR